MSDRFSVQAGLSCTVGTALDKVDGCSMRKKRFWRPSPREQREFLLNPDKRPGGGRGAHNRTISPILSRGSLSSCSEGGQASSISWEGTPASEPEFKVFNVSGSYFMIETDIFARYPDTLLGSHRLEQFYRPNRDEYFIEHNKYVFPAVLRFYTHQEELICPPCIPKDTFEECLEFYELSAYHQGLKSAIKPGQEELEPKNWKEKLSYTLQFPYYSFTAKVYAIFDIMVIILSTITLVLESIPELTRYQSFNSVAEIIEACVNVYFTVQAVLLLSVFPSWKDYFKNPLHWIDIVSILPFYLRVAAGSYFNQIKLPTINCSMMGIRGTKPALKIYCRLQIKINCLLMRRYLRAPAPGEL